MWRRKSGKEGEQEQGLHLPIELHIVFVCYPCYRCTKSHSRQDKALIRKLGFLISLYLPAVQLAGSPNCIAEYHPGIMWNIRFGQQNKTGAGIQQSLLQVENIFRKCFQNNHQ